MRTITRARATEIARDYIAPDAPALTALGTGVYPISDHLMTRLPREISECYGLAGSTAADDNRVRLMLRWAMNECDIRGIDYWNVMGDAYYAATS